MFDTTYSVRPEFQLIQALARTHPGPEYTAHARRVIAEGHVQWSFLNRLGLYHGLLPLVAHNLLRSCSDVLPDLWTTEGKQYLFKTRAFHHFLIDELGRLQRSLDEHGIAAISLKGPVLAQLAYGDANLRPYVDLDLLIDRSDYDAVEALLLRDGYQPFQKVRRLSPIRKRIWLWQAAQMPFSRGTGVFNLDLHTGIMPPMYYYPISFDTLWGRSFEVEIGPARVHSFAREDMLLVLCYHGEKNRWETLKYVCDLAQLLRSSPDLDWDDVMKRAEQTRSERLLYLGLQLADNLLDAPLPDEIRQRVARSQTATALATEVQHRLPHQLQRGVIDFRERVRFHLRLQRTVATKARYLAHALLRRVRSMEHA